MRQSLTVVALVLALAGYTIDCVAETPQQAMQCCKTMQCSSNGHHDIDCCKTMPGVRAALGQPSCVQGHAFDHTALAVVALNISSSFDSSRTGVIAHSHAPPIYSSPPISALRI